MSRNFGMKFQLKMFFFAGLNLHCSLQSGRVLIIVY